MVDLCCSNAENVYKINHCPPTFDFYADFIDKITNLAQYKYGIMLNTILYTLLYNNSVFQHV